MLSKFSLNKNCKKHKITHGRLTPTQGSNSNQSWVIQNLNCTLNIIMRYQMLPFIWSNNLFLTLFY